MVWWLTVCVPMADAGLGTLEGTDVIRVHADHARLLRYARTEIGPDAELGAVPVELRDLMIGLHNYASSITR